MMLIMSEVNPYAKRKAPTEKLKPRPCKPRYGTAQAAFIEQTRVAIDADPFYFRTHEWTRIQCGGNRYTTMTHPKKITVDSFYVKDLAVWIPHLLTPNYVPTCCRCLSKVAVGLDTTNWVENPKVLCGVFTHRHFDTKCCRCADCKSDFVGWHPVTLRHDAQEIAGILNFRMSKGFAVDDELHTFIVTHNTDTTASIHQKLKKGVADNWINDATHYFKAVLSNRVKKRNPNYLDGTNQRALDRHLEIVKDLGPAEKRAKRLRSLLAHAEEQLAAAQTKASRDVQFVDTFEKKKNRNVSGLPFKGIGRSKCLVLIKHGILSAKDLLEYDGGSPAILESWIDIVQAHYNNLTREVFILQKKKSEAEEELKDELALQEMFGCDDDDKSEHSEPMDTVAEKEQRVPEPKIPTFSKLADPLHCDARVISKATVDRIKATDYQKRKSMQIAKMRSVTVHVWKIDWGYKIAPKIKVYTGQGKPCSPCRSVVSIQNEDSLTMFFKCCPCSEGIDAMEADLRLLLKRHKAHKKVVKVSYVDNCCSVRQKMQKITPGILVKLDCFHWQKRWDPVFVDLKSEKTIIFRSLMRRALFVTEEEEINRVRQDFARRKKNPLPADVFKEAKSTMPPPDVLEKRVLCVIHAVMEKDLELDRLQTMGASASNEKRFLKPGAMTLNTIVNQMEHVKAGCLSDPPSEIVEIHRVNATAGKAFTARGTGGNEAAWRYVNRLLDTPSIGITRAEQVIHNYFEGDNDRKRVARLGEQPEETSRTEQLQALHGLAARCGFSGSEIPVPEDMCPSDIADFDEHIGLDYQLPLNFNVDDIREEAIDDDDDENLEDLADFLKDVEFDPDNEENPVQEDLFGLNDTVDLSLLEPTIINNESAHAAFSRLTEKQPWLPFKDPRLVSTFTPLDNAEMALFDEMEDSYDRKGALSSSRGYKTFAKAWNLHVSNLFARQLAGEKVVVVNRKSAVQLQEHYDRKTRQKELLALSNRNRNDPVMKRMEKCLHDTRKAMAPHQTSVNTNPLQHNTQLGRPQFGAPYALNTEIMTNAFQHDQSRTHIQFKPYDNDNAAVVRISRDVLGKSFKARSFCWRCGFKKTEHLRANLPFGADCKDNCGHEECAKCCTRMSFECHSNGRIGPHCTNEPHPTKSKCAEWGLIETLHCGII